MSRKNRNKTSHFPGSLIFTGDAQASGENSVTILQYGEQGVIELEDLNQLKPQTWTWIDIKGLNQPDLLESLGKRFNIHPLVLEDIMDVHQKPKMQEYEEGIFFQTRSIFSSQDDGTLHTEQISFYLTQYILFTFQEHPDDTFQIVRDGLKSNKARMQNKGPDFLTFILLDKITDYYVHGLEDMDDRLKELELESMQNPSKQTKSAIFARRSELVNFQYVFQPFEMAATQFHRSTHAVIHPRTRYFLRDLLNTLHSIAADLERHRERIHTINELFNSEINYRTNRIIHMLTIISTIFIPLTFIVGIYGMNFDFMPELRWKWGYPVVMAFMLSTALGMLYYFKSKRWL